MPTQAEVARLAGVSQTTASYVLSGVVNRVSLATQERVLRAAEQLNYQPNLLARGLRGSSTGLLGVIVRDISAGAVGSVCRALLHGAPQVGYDMVLTDAADDVKTLLRLAGLMKSRLCDGIVLVGELPEEDILWEDYARLGIPTVAILHGGDDLPVASVLLDNEQGIRLAVEHLRALGHEHIGFVGSSLLRGVRQRAELFRAVMRDEGLAVREHDVVEVELSREGGAAGLVELLGRPRPPTAVIAATDLLACAMVHEAARRKIAVPEQLSIVGFDDVPEASITWPPLTTVRQPFKDFAVRALEMFTSGAASSTRAHRHVTLPPELVVRESTAAPTRTADRLGGR
ncbi:MAG: LacI family DNA-binding transcriptional regulator [Actinomycetota bacterium]|nr:LacI family DNA-binding transcriptional regulator [Actinomycetota bacterium]